MRCMTLADRLLSLGQTTHFLCRSLPQSLHDRLVDRGHAVTILPGLARADFTGRLAHSAWLGMEQEDDARACLRAMDGTVADWIVADHYALDAEWETVLRPHCHKLLVIDDLADRRHDCDILLDQNLGRSAKDYSHLVPAHCALLTGPEHALLRPEFAGTRAMSLTRRAGAGLDTVLVSMGGFNKDNVTEKVLDALAASILPKDCTIGVVMGSKAPFLDAVKDRASRMPQKTEVLVDREDMASLMAKADLALGAAGSTAWERACLGLPTLMFVLADNQKDGAKALADHGCALMLQADDTLVEKLNIALVQLENPETLASMQQACAHLTDGLGAIRLAERMTRDAIAADGLLRIMTDADLPMVRAWRNHDSIRTFMLTQDDIAPDAHRSWFEKASTDPNRHLMIFEQDRQPNGFMNLKVDPASNSADWGFYAAPGAPKGTGTRMGEAAIAYAFQTLGVNKICGQVLDYNEASLRFHQRLGFQKEGVLRAQARINTVYHDVVCFGLLKREWSQTKMRVN
jgi:UDP-2,4-diacetamido-2,4,6-trideoxy-beta-L-altropyranose hydrolase/UDP-4-amino-4,6-dideoxy-N-acetyl-beta-L-altrosamine N-acetyltransferase